MLEAQRVPCSTPSTTESWGLAVLLKIEKQRGRRRDRGKKRERGEDRWIKTERKSNVILLENVLGELQWCNSLVCSS